MPISGSSRLYGGVTAEDRIAERRRKLLEAGMNLFGDPASGSIRVRDVCAEAGLTERYFYENFTGLEALFEAVLQQTIEAIESSVNAAVEEVSEIDLRGAAALRTVMTTLAKDPRKIQILYVEALGRGERAKSRYHGLTLRGAENLFMWTRSEEATFETSAIENKLEVIALSGAVEELLLSWAEGLLDITPDDLADYLVGLYERIALPKERPRKRRDAAKRSSRG